MISRRTWLAGVATLALAVPGRHALAQSGGDEAAHDYVVHVADELRQTLAGASTDAERRQRLMPFLDRVVDVRSTAQFCLGRFWPRATPAQQQQIVQLFLEAIAQAVSTRVNAFENGGGHIETLPASNRPDGVEVTTLVSEAGGSPTHLSWLLEPSGGSYRIVDVSAEGLSMRVSKRSDYVSYLARHNGDIASFIAALEAHLKA